MAGRKTFRTDIVIGGKVNPTLQKATTSVVRYVNQIRTAMLGTLGIASVSMAFNTVKKQLSDCVEKAKAQNEAEVKLKNALANNIQLRKLGAKAQEQSFHALTNEASWLQKIGVIGDEVALAGMQQLATYQLSTAQIVKLSAGMNNLLVKQNGLNATQENAVDIAKLMGKALSGNAGALTRYGIQMSEAEKKTFKTATQAQRVALLTRILERNVGGVNRAMANTPEGKIQQVNNLYGDMQERIGTKLLPIYGKLAEVALRALPTVENAVYKVIGALSGIYRTTTNIINFVQSNAIPILATLSGIIAGFATYKAIQGFQMLQVQMALASKEAGIFGAIANGNLLNGLKLMTSAVWKSVTALWAQATALLANPITWVVLGVAALTTGLVALALNWDKVTNAISKAYDKFKQFLHLKGNNNEVNAPQVDTTTTGHKALGTHSFVGGETWVGEHGPERISLPRGTEILSNNKSTAASSSGSVNMNCTFNFNVSGSADASTVQNAVTSVVPNIKAQIDAYFRQKQRLGYSF